MTNAHPPSVSPEGVQPGDILFFAPRSDGRDFTKFDELAAYVQGVPYGGHAPWHHVAVVGPRDDRQPWPTVIGFPQTGGEGGDGSNWDPQVASVGWAATDGYLVTALRPPHSGEAIARQANETVGQPYAINGLLAFAVAMQARMLVAGPARERLFDYAAGAETEARKTSDGQTCVTAVMTAVEQAGYELLFSEPQPPAVPVDDDTKESIEKLFARVQTGSGLEELDAVDGDLLLDHEQVAQGWGVFAHAAFPGLIELTSDYVKLLADVLDREFDGISAGQLVALGQLARQGQTAGWRTSPAMLHDALLRAGFTPVQ